MLFLLLSGAALTSFSFGLMVVVVVGGGSVDGGVGLGGANQRVALSSTSGGGSGTAGR